MDLHALIPAAALLAWTTYFVGVASPGPSTLAIMSVAMSAGRRPALTFASGVASGAFFWAIMATAGLSAIIATRPGLINAIKIAGGCYFLWLAYKSGRSALRPASPLRVQRVDPDATGARLYLRGLLMHLTNPKAVLIWMSIVAMGSGTARHATMSGSRAPGPDAVGMVGITVGCMAIGATVFASYAVLFSTAPARRIYAACGRWLDGALTVVFLAAGISLLTLRL